MTERILFILVYSLSALVCFLVTTGLLFLKQLRSVRSRKYRNACRFLALASALVGTSSLLTLLVGESELAQLGLVAFPVLLVASSQSLLFTFMLILLFREKQVTRRNILLHASPSIVLTVLYILACCFCDDPKVYSFSQWAAQSGNPALLIRSAYLLTYLVQLLIYTRLFFRQRALYCRTLDTLTDRPRQLELRWVTRLFLYALGIGLLAATLCLYIPTVYETAVTVIFAAFYLLTGFYYVNYHFTYNFLRDELTRQEGSTPPPDTSLDTLVGELAVTQKKEELLFKNAEELMQSELPYIAPDFNRQKLIQALFTNEHYLTAAIRKGAGRSFNIQTYITNYRIEHARTLLSNPFDNRSIEQIATDSGFSTIRTFNRCFKETTGMTPSKFREIHPTVKTNTKTGL